MFGINPVLDAFWVGVIFGVIVVLYFFITHVHEDGGPERWERWRASWIMWSERRRAGSARSVPNQPERATFELEPEPEPLPNPASGRRTDDRTGAFVLNPDQQLAVTRMIYHKTANPSATKATTIKAGFGVSKGESSRYKEASAIYDALFVLRDVEKYPHMTTEQQQLREQLHLGNR